MQSKHLLLTCLVFFIASLGYSQETRFIEFKVTDTVELKPQKIYYEISIQSANNPEARSLMSMNRNADTGKVSKQPNSSTKQIIDFLKTQGLLYNFTDGDTYNITQYGQYGRNADSTILVTLNSESELKNLHHMLLSMPNITTHIERIEYENAAPFESGSYMRLLEKAKIQASFIAAASGSSVGQLISIEEDKNPFADVLEQIRNSGLSGINSAIFGQGNLNKKILKTVLCKYQLK